ncbi:hypothetical protein CGH13_22485 [Vibrio parahaemolyticus]|nr:hypothetical protein CGH13_22485 [Vibrio parahaemolyticus]
MQEEKRSYIARSSGKSLKLKLSYRRSISVLTSVVKSKIGIVSTVDLFFGAVTLGLTESNFFAETLLVEFVGTKADLLAEMALSLVW